MGLSTIKLMIQPIVENAICHGMEFMDETGLITIDAAIQDGDLVIAVKDNGLGMTEEQVARLLDPNAPPEAAPGRRRALAWGYRMFRVESDCTLGRAMALPLKASQTWEPR